MNLEDLLEQIKEKWATVWSAIQDSPTYNSIKEQYETWPAEVQKLVVGGLIALVAIIFFYIPYSFISSADFYVEEFEAKRDLINEVLHTSRIPQGKTAFPSDQPISTLKNRFENALNEFNLTPEQIAGTQSLDKMAISGLATPPVLADGFSLSVKDLNLQQLVDIGFRLQNLASGVKMIGIDIKATPTDDHYYNVIYNFVSFTLPVEEEEDTGDDKGKSQRKSRRKNRGNK